MECESNFFETLSFWKVAAEKFWVSPTCNHVSALYYPQFKSLDWVNFVLFWHGYFKEFRANCSHVAQDFDISFTCFGHTLSAYVGQARLVRFWSLLDEGWKSVNETFLGLNLWTKLRKSCNPSTGVFIYEQMAFLSQSIVP